MKFLNGLGVCLLVCLGVEAKMPIGGQEKFLLTLEDSAGNPVKVLENARVDTGATQSSLNATEIEIVEVDGVKYVQFRTKTDTEEFEVRAPYIRKKRVRSSDGAVENRHVISLKGCLGKELILFQATLSERAKLRNPMLVGRTVLAGRYTVDVESDYLLGDPTCK